MGKIADVQEVTLTKLVPYANNAKKHPQEQIDLIVRSIKEYGFLNPCLIDRDYNIIAGHGRVMAAKQMGMDKVPCLFVEGLTEAQYKAYVLADNKLTEMGEWDMELVMSELEDLQDMNFDISLTGFDMPDDESDPIEAEDVDIPEMVETRCKIGDIWDLGGVHRLICGDSTDVSVIERLMDGQQADMLLTDPPYNVDYVGKTKEALVIQNDKMGDSSFRQFLSDAFSASNSVMRKGAVFYIWHSGTEAYNFIGALRDNEWLLKEVLIWAKNSMVMGRQDYQWQHEPCLYGWKDGASHLWASDRKQTTLLHFDRPTKNLDHPTMKPVPLFAYQIGNNTHEGDAVLDIFGGSGTTLMACEQLNRKAYTCELDPHYCDVILQRWEDYTGKKAQLVEKP